MYTQNETPVDDGSARSAVPGEALRRLRVKAGLPLRAVQQRCGISAARLSRIENGHVDARFSTIRRILAALDADLADLAVEVDAATPSEEADRGTSLMETVLSHRRLIHELMAVHGASHPRIFGSVARGASGPDSDVDFLVDLEPGRSLFDLAALRVELEEKLGVSVDVVPSAGLEGEVRSEILADAIAI